MLIVGGAVTWYSTNHNAGSAVNRFQDRSHDLKLIDQTTAMLDAEVSQQREILSPQLVPLGIRITEPPKSKCYEGDPALYKYACWTNDGLEQEDAGSAISQPDDAAQELSKLNQFLVAHGWKLGSNDFRTSQSRPYSQWSTLIAAPDGVHIEYVKGDCDLSFDIMLPRQARKSSGQLSCAKDLLPDFYF